MTAFDTAHLDFANVAVTIDALPDAAPPGTSGYQAYVGNCPQNGSGFTTPPTTFGGIAWPCVTAGKAPLLVASIGTTDGGPNQELGYTYAKGNVLLADGGTTPLSPTVPWASAETTQTLTAQNVTSGSSGWLSFSEIAGGVALSNLTNFSGGTSDDGGPLSESSGFVEHPGYAEAVQGEATLYEYLQHFQFDAIRSIAAHSGVPDGSTALPPLDLSSVLPEITASSIDTTDAGTPSQPVVNWTSAASLATTHADRLGDAVVGGLRRRFGERHVDDRVAADRDERCSAVLAGGARHLDDPNQHGSRHRRRRGVVHRRVRAAPGHVRGAPADAEPHQRQPLDRGSAAPRRWHAAPHGRDAGGD